MNFTQFLNRNAKILGRRLHSPSLKDVAWLEDAQLFFLIFHTWLGRQTGRRSRGEKNYRQMYGKLEKLTERLLIKLHPSNLVNKILLT